MLNISVMNILISVLNFIFFLIYLLSLFYLFIDLFCITYLLIGLFVFFDFCSVFLCFLVVCVCTNAL